jgi:RNA polymerase sigma factor (sigma-70 family)
MTGTAARRAPKQPEPSADQALIASCLNGDQEAWARLIDKYKNLIYSIPVKLGMHQDASDIFQSVCVDLLAELPKLREHRALPKWLMQTCYHRCLHHRRMAGRNVELDTDAVDDGRVIGRGLSPPEEMLVQLEREQALRDAIAQLPSRCERMIQMLFFSVPPLPYDAVAKELRLATGSIGFIRGRCLTRLKNYLEKKGF